MGNVNVMQSVFKRNTIYFMTFYKRGWAFHPNRAVLKHVVTSKRKKQWAASGWEVPLTCRRAEDAAKLRRFMSATRKSTACLSERPICGQTDRQAGRQAGRGGLASNVNVIQIYGRQGATAARAVEDQILFMSLKCTQAKTFAPKAERHANEEEGERGKKPAARVWK